MLYGLVFCWGLWVIDYKLIACFLLTQEVGTCIQPFPLHLSLSQRVCTEILAVFFFWRRSWLCGFLLYISYGLFLDEYFSSCTLLQFYFGSFFFFFFGMWAVVIHLCGHAADNFYCLYSQVVDPFSFQCLALLIWNNNLDAGMLICIWGLML